MNDKELETGNNIYTMIDEETGDELSFELKAAAEVDGAQYYLVKPLDEELEEDMFVILKTVIDENGEETYISIDDDDEFDKLADIFDDMLDTDEDYDA